MVKRASNTEKKKKTHNHWRYLLIPVSYCFVFLFSIFRFAALLLLCSAIQLIHINLYGIGFDLEQWSIQNGLLTGAKIFMGPSKSTTTKRKTQTCTIAFLSLFSNRISIVICNFVRMCVCAMLKCMCETFVDECVSMLHGCLKWSHIFLHLFQYGTEKNALNNQQIEDQEYRKCTLNEHLCSLFTIRGVLCALMMFIF